MVLILFVSPINMFMLYVVSLGWMHIMMCLPFCVFDQFIPNTILCSCISLIQYNLLLQNY